MEEATLKQITFSIRYQQMSAIGARDQDSVGNRKAEQSSFQHLL